MEELASSRTSESSSRYDPSEDEIPTAATSPTDGARAGPATASSSDSAAGSEEDEDGESVLEYALALHSFVPPATSTTCLAFRAGQVIRTLNRDASGWWDGELDDGTRGWFPSNYVIECDEDGRTKEGTTATAGSADDQSDSADGCQSPEATLTIKEPEERKARPISLTPVLQAIALLRNAVLAERVPHFQPSTAGVISAVRVVLSDTSCLTRDSPMVLLNPSIAVSRKQILSSLAALVSQARKASAPGIALEERSQQTRTMIVMAESVWTGAQTFLKTIAQLQRASLSAEPVDAPPTSPLRDLTVQVMELPMDRPVEAEQGANRSLVIRSTAHLSELLTSMHDQLLSTIAAFIGHVHAHTRSSHSSSYAYLIDMTRETIERVREILVVLEAVASYPLFATQSGSRSTAELEASRETLYVATTSLVTAARVATSAPEIEVVGGTTEDEEKRTLLQSATAVLRSGGDAIGAVKKCIARRVSDDESSSLPFELALPQLVQTESTVFLLPTPSDPERRSSLAAPSGIQSHINDSISCFGGATSRMTTLEVPPKSSSSTRSSHALSMLGRKATSLSCLRDMYEAGSGVCHPVDEERERDDGSQLRSPTESDRSKLGVSATASYNRRPSIPEGVQSKAHDGRLDLRMESRFTGGPTSTSMIVQRSAPNFGVGFTPARPILHSRTSSRTSSRGGGLATSSTSSVAMSRNESSRTSESAASSRSAFSRSSTTDTSPRTSTSTAPDKCPTSPTIVESEISTFLPVPVPALGRADVYSSQSTASSSTLTSSATTPVPSSPVRASRPPPTRRPSGPLPLKEGTTWYLARDYEAQEIAFNGDGHVTGGTLRCLIERMTLHDTTIDLTFSNTFFLTFRMFTTPVELSQVLYRRYDILPSPELHPDELREWNASKATPVRLRIYNFFKTWLESYWQGETDMIILESLMLFCRNRVAGTMASASQRLVDLAQKRLRAGATSSPVEPIYSSMIPGVSLVLRGGLERANSSEKMKAGKVVELGDPYLPLRRGGPPPPSPVVTKGLLAQLRTLSSGSINVMDIDPLELARQFTIMESRLYCAIKADELLSQDFVSKAGKSSSINIKAMSSLSTRITGWISETILNEQDAKKRTSLVKYFIKLSERCFALNNFNTLLAVLCALNSSTISRLKKTWDGLSSKYRTSLDLLRKSTEHSRNYAEYRSKIRDAPTPCLPFLGLFLTDVTFCYEGNPAERASPLAPTLRLINFDRYQKMAKIVGEMVRFQTPYNLLELPEIQNYLRSALDGLTHGGDGTSLYRQSLVVEPRSTFDAPQNSLFNWKS